MIPSVLSQQLRQGVEDFLRTTFPVATHHFNGILERLLAQEEGVFKGPYVSIQLPFRQGAAGPDFFPEVPMRFIPHLHQEKAFERLSGASPRSTLIATGTGSGKTECFTHPILEYCRLHAGEPGIKAILIYPMNALALDQAGRLARHIYANPSLKGQVTAGLYVGQSEKDPRMVMTAEGIISHKETLRNAPPDILLTNYKMLDYLLIRPKDLPLWRGNGPGTLRYLVVDELHTFDGAQGTDLACLIRRLKARLGTPSGRLCCVGTSATLGSRTEEEALRRYAEEVFGEPFDRAAVIMEERLSAGEFLGESLIPRAALVPAEKAEALEPDRYADCEAYLTAQALLWFGEGENAVRADEAGWCFRVPELLKGHLFFHNLLKVLAGRIRSRRHLLDELGRVTPEFREGNELYRIRVLDSFLALVSAARTGESVSPLPFLNVRHQLWLRELRRMVAEVSGRPSLAFADDLTVEQLKRHLPLVHCRECNSMGWAGVKRKSDTAVNPDLKTFYTAFFQGDPKVVFLFPDDTEERSLQMDGRLARLCCDCLHLTANPKQEQCTACGGEALVRVFVPALRTRNVKGRSVASFDCPYCGARKGLTILGSRAASLTSVLIAQLNASTFNHDKRLLTFSDSVQDAAHRAGFFAGRTYRFNFRGALQQYVLSETNGHSLATLPEGFIRYWSERMDEGRFVSTFLAPNMAWYADYEVLKATGGLPADSDLPAEVEKRIGWEILAEYGFGARIGRTLEKSGSSVPYTDPGPLAEAARLSLLEARNQLEGLRRVGEERWWSFILGVLAHMRVQGGMLHPVLERYIQEWGNTYLLNRIPWMPGFGPDARAPSFLTTARGHRFETLLAGGRGGRTWCEAWAEKCFAERYPFVRELTASVYDILLTTLVRAGILEERVVRNERLWGIAPSALKVSRQVVQFRCGRCSHHVSVAEEEAPFWEGAPCLRFHCSGAYEREDRKADYYGRLYATGDIERIFAAEHTGLLEREERQRLEAAFKAVDRRPWDPNLLSCTPTLEMGIDIGELSSVILCSVPPAPANYLQRIGRSGRRNGNSLDLTLANARPHDLYFFAEPEAMLSGRIEPPGVFLNASAVLERQFTAFCLDRWVETGIGEHAIPARLRQVLEALEPVKPDRFPHNFLAFIEANRAGLLDGFLEAFPGVLSPDSVKHLKAFVEGRHGQEGSLAYRILEGLFFQQRERDSLKRKIKTLTGKIARKKKEAAQDAHHGEELEELEREKSGLRSLLAGIGDKQTLNFMSDEGLIPNYAFPEAGVLLRSIVYRLRKRLREGDRRYETFTYEYERPAMSAISELAPANHFYAGGRKVRIDQVGLDVSEIENWRFCPNCEWMALAGTVLETGPCPRCGSPLWADAGQVRPMLRMRKVVASTSDSESRISDDSEDRDPVFYNRQMMVGYDEKDITDAYKLETDQMPFGFEFLSRAQFREINFGESDENGPKVAIAGVEMPRKGFTICKHCGKVQDRTGEIRHALFCPSRHKESDANLTECVYLYREFSSEAIQFLLPVTTFEGAEKKLHSFIAALHLGLKRFFHGNIDHLQTTVHEEPIPGSAQRKKYLVLYDTVPGGTGYLKQLMRSEQPLIQVFETALETLRACACNQDPEKDGCYQCLYAYRRSHQMAGTSRETAVGMLSDILRHREKLVRAENLKGVQLNALFDSELEARFVEALRTASSGGVQAFMTKEVVNGKPGYYYRIGERAYYIEPQVKLGPGDGVGVPSKADFVFRPARAQDGGLPVAVFTDGFAYHKDRIGEDMAQRCAIARSGNFHVWSLSWRDVENRFKGQGDYFQNYLTLEGEGPQQKYKAFVTRYGLGSLQKVNIEDSFAGLIRYLSQPEPQKWAFHAYVHALMHAADREAASSQAKEAWLAGLGKDMPDELSDLLFDLGGPCLYGVYAPEGAENLLRLYVCVAIEAVKSRDPGGMRVACALASGEEARAKGAFEAVWNGYLRLYNLMQFLPEVLFSTTDAGVRLSAYKAALEKRRRGPTPSLDRRQAWKEVFELAEESVRGVVESLAEGGAPLPEAGYELADGAGEIVAEAELAWPERKAAVLLPSQEGFAGRFQEAGWRVFALAELTPHPPELLCLLKS